MKEVKKFWMVLGHDAPSHKHETFDDAKSEAERLARKEGRTFTILEAVGVVTAIVQDIPTAYSEIK